MKNIIYIPLDERPCNALYPVYMAGTRDDINLITPPSDMLGRKKQSADIEGLWDFVYSNAGDAEAIVMSIEMMCYGGLLPSRLHHFDEGHRGRIIDNIRRIKEINKNIIVFASNLIMRTPRYSSSEEEPDYYERYGEQVFKRAYLMDKKSRESISHEEEKQLKKYDSLIPGKYVEDYEARRKYNVSFNMEVLKLVEKGLMDFLSIPQDDSSEYGYTAIDQRKVYNAIKEKKLQRKVFVYPGADEVGSSLLARAVSTLDKRQTRIYPFFASLNGPNVIPLYEDRPMYESLKSHIMVTNSVMAEGPDDADLILAYNCPGKFMQEAEVQDQKDVTYNSFRNLFFFVDRISKYINEGKKVIVADSAFCNGGEIELVTLLDDCGILDKVISYKGWNTNCNTLGTTIAQGVIASGGNTNKAALRRNLIYHIIEDVLYQSIIRTEIVREVLPGLGLSYFNLKDKIDEINKIRDEKLISSYNNLIRNSFKDMKLKSINSFNPWNRMFEMGANLELEAAE